MNMDFGANKTPVEGIKKRTFWGTYFRDISSNGNDNSSSVNGKWYRKSRKEFDELGDIDQKYCCSNFYDVSVNKYGVKCERSIRFAENNVWINSIDPYGWFQWVY